MFSQAMFSTSNVDVSTLWQLFAQFLSFSMLSVGGAISVVPEMHRVLVDNLHVLTDTQFSAAIAIGQAAPGPNLLFVTVMGYQIAGLTGVFIFMAGLLLPSCTLAFAVGRFGRARQDWLPVQAFKLGMAPLTLALLVAVAWILTANAVEVHGLMHTTAWVQIGMTVIAALLVWKTRVHLLFLIAAGGVIGAMGWV